MPSDAEFRMRRWSALDLGDAVAVVATVGTTSTTSVDPVPAIADACAAAGVWLHVDASYAGSAAVCPELRSLAGVDRADSLVVNPHKWLFTPIDCSGAVHEPAERAARRFQPRPRVPANDRRGRDEPDGLRPALGRRFRALKLWAVIRVFGREGLQRTIREHVRMAAEFERWVERSRLGAVRTAAVLGRVLPAGGLTR